MSNLLVERKVHFFSLTTTILLILFCLYSPLSAFAETRNIYVGDIITLEISAHGLSEDELRQKFEKFEIIDLKTAQGQWLLSIRTFEIGESTIFIGDKELIITVASVLDDIQRDGFFEGEGEILAPGIIFYWHILFYIAVVVFVLSGCFVILRAFRKKKLKQESPYERFLRRSAALLTDDENYFVDLTLYFKEYLEGRCNRRIIGKTSSEVVNELKDIQGLKELLSAIWIWMSECDTLKFSGVIVSNSEKQGRYKQLLSLVESIETNQYDVNEGTA